MLRAFVTISMRGAVLRHLSDSVPLRVVKKRKLDIFSPANATHVTCESRRHCLRLILLPGSRKGFRVKPWFFPFFFSSFHDRQGCQSWSKNQIQQDGFGYVRFESNRSRGLFVMLSLFLGGHKNIGTLALVDRRGSAVRCRRTLDRRTHGGHRREFLVAGLVVDALTVVSGH